MKITLDTIKDTIRDKKQGALSKAYNTRSGLPFGGKFGTRFQRRLVASAIRDLSLKHGQLVLGNLVIGSNTAVPTEFGLSANNKSALDQLICNLVDSELSTFTKELLESWRQGKIDNLEIREEEELSGAESFAKQRFTGFT